MKPRSLTVGGYIKSENISSVMPLCGDDFAWMSHGTVRRGRQCYTAISISDEKSIALFTSVPLTTPFDAITYHGNRQFICSHPESKSIQLWDTQTGKAESIAEFKDTRVTQPVSCLASLSSDDLVSGHESGEVYFWNTEESTYQLAFTTGLPRVQNLLFLQQRNVLVATDGAGSFCFYNLSTNTSFLFQLSHLDVRTGDIFASRHETCLVVATMYGINFLNIENLDSITSRKLIIPRSLGAIRTCALRADGYLMTGHEGGSMRIVDPKSQAITLAFDAGREPIRAIAILTNGNLVYSTRAGATVCRLSSVYYSYKKRLSNSLSSFFGATPNGLIDIMVDYAAPACRLESNASKKHSRHRSGA